MKENMKKENKSNSWITFAVVVVVAIIAAYFGYMFAFNGSPDLQPAPSSSITLTGFFVGSSAEDSFMIDIDGDGNSDAIFGFYSDVNLGRQFGSWKTDAYGNPVTWESRLPKGTKVRLECDWEPEFGGYLCKKKTIGPGAWNSLAGVQGDGSSISPSDAGSEEQR